MFDVVVKLLKGLASGKGHFPPTILYNEGWLLRLVLNWFSENQINGHPISFQPKATWFSEGLLSSQFLPRYRGDKLSEAYTHADGIIGNIMIGKKGKGDVYFVEPFNQLVVMEAKLFSVISSGTKRVPGYNQIARNVACIANVISDSDCNVNELKYLGFYVLSPESQIKAVPAFTNLIKKDNIHKTVLSRVELYKKDYDDYSKKREWFKQYFEPVLSQIDLRLISWEDVINDINQHDAKTGQDLSEFYSKCLTFNG